MWISPFFKFKGNIILTPLYSLLFPFILLICNQAGSGAIDGSWSDWTAFSECTVTCGPGGNQTRTRECNNPEPSNGGADCPNLEDDSIETQPCNFQDCK